MTELLTQNAKMRKSGGDKYSIYNFGISAYKAKDGTVTCPMAGSCGKSGGCYALQGAYVWTNVTAAYNTRFKLTQKKEFSVKVLEAIDRKEKTAARKGKQLVIRIHDSGDFYSKEYLAKWMEVITARPNVKFYAYTKMIHFFKDAKRPPNLVIIYSEGGRLDKQIDVNKDRHSRIFGSIQELKEAGYADTTADDSKAFGDNPKIGLVYHGAKSKTWKTGA